jgi:hypothetical protein
MMGPESGKQVLHFYETKEKHVIEKKTEMKFKSASVSGLKQY